GYDSVLQCHARVYCLGQYTQIQELSDLALGRLILSLERLPKVLTKRPHAVKAVIDLCSYVYQHTTDLVNTEEPLREVVSTFAAQSYFALSTAPEFQQLIDDDGEFVVDLMKIVRRLKWTE
ncbi:hypothetical protein K440DRAFT_520011, partial [Wilcoxina mikolae CBS 423.85]